MNTLSYADLIAMLFSALGAAVVVIGSASRAAKTMGDAMASRIEHSIAVLDGREDANAR